MYSTNLRICDFQLLCLSLINCSLKLPPVCTMYLVIAEFWVWKHFANTLSSLYFCRLDEIQKRNFRICVLIVNAHADVLVRPIDDKMAYDNQHVTNHRNEGVCEDIGYRYLQSSVSKRELSLCVVQFKKERSGSREFSQLYL